MKVRIKKVPKKAYGGQQSNGALDVTPAKWGGGTGGYAKDGAEVQQSLTSVPRSKANLEAEGGETAFGPISGDTIPDHYKITGPRHSNGGVPLNLPDDTFIFSDTKAMKITDPKILVMFGKTSKKGGYTPADLAKPFDINKYKGILLDKNTDRKDRETAELMIKNYIMKLGALALAQESKKGFPQGIPEMAKPYMEANGISEDQLMPQQEQEGGAGEQPMMKNGGLKEFKGNDPTQGSSIMSDSRSKELYEEKKKKNPNGPGGSFTGGWAEWEALSPQEQSPYLQKDIKGAFNNAKTLETTPSYQNATDQQRALFESMNPQQRQMMRGVAGQQQTGQGQQQGYYPNQRGGRRGFSDFNPFGQRAFTKDFDYLTPFNSPTFSGTNTPFTGQMPAGNNQLTSFSQNYKKNPLLKSMFSGWINPEKNVARRELTNTWNFNGAGSSTPSLAGGNNAISNFKTPQLDFNQSTQSGFNPQSNQGAAGNLSNRQFARDFQNQGFGSKRDIRKDLRKGNMTQQEYMDLMNQENSPTTTTGSGPIPKPNNSGIPSWITNPVGSAMSGTGSSSDLNLSRLSLQPANQFNKNLGLPISNDAPYPKLQQSFNNSANPTSGSKNAFTTGNDAAISLGGRLNQMRTNAATRIGDNTIEDNTFDFNSNRTNPTNTFGQKPIVKSLDTQGTDGYRRSLINTASSDGRSSNFNPDYGDGFAYGGYAKDGVEVEDNKEKPAYNTLYPASETQPMNPNAVAGEDSDVYDPYFAKAYYGDRSLGQRKAGEEGYETSTGGVDFSSVDKKQSSSSNPSYDQWAINNWQKNWPQNLSFAGTNFIPLDKNSYESKVYEDGKMMQHTHDANKRQEYLMKLKWNNLEPKRQGLFKYWRDTKSEAERIWGKDSQEAIKAGTDAFRAQFTISDQLEDQWDKKYGWDNEKDMPRYNRGESMNVDGTVPGSQNKMSYIGKSYPGMAFGGENPILDMFVYGGNNKYPHGGSFHMPMNDFAKDFQSNTSTELGNPMAQTAEDPFVNLYGESSGVVSNSETGGYDETNPEYAEGNNPFSVENTQKVNSAFTFRPQVAMAQTGALGRVGENIFNGYNAGLNEASAENIARQQTSKEGVRRGGDMANEQGVMSTNANSPYSQQSYMTKYGGTPRAMYGMSTGDDDPVTPNQFDNFQPMDEVNTVNKPSVGGTRDFTTHFNNNLSQPVMREQPTYSPATDPNMTKNYMTDRQGNITGQAYVPAGKTYNSRKLNRQFKRGKVQGESFYDGEYAYGGTPMAMYGADMGGAYYPTMEDGGSRKVRILPTAKHGKSHKNPDGTPKTQAELQAELDAGGKEVQVVSKKELPDGTVIIKKADGTVVHAIGDKSGSTAKDRDFNVPTNITNKNVDVCAEIKKGRGGKSFTRGEALAVGMVNERTADNFTNCYGAAETEKDNSKFYEVKAEETPAPDGKKKCTCYEIDEQGNQTTKVVSETIIDPSKGETCDCEATVEAMRGADPKDPGGYSDMELKAIRESEKMITRMPRFNAKYVQAREAIPTLVSPRVADIKSKGAQNVRAMQAAGMKPNQIVAALMGPGMQQSLDQQGKRYAQADTTNAGILTDAGYKNLQAQGSVDGANAQIYNTIDAKNKNQKEKEIRSINAKGALKLASRAAAEKGRLDRATTNFALEDFQIDRNNNPYKRYNPKDPNPTKPGQTRKQLYADYVKTFGKDDPNIGRLADADYKEQAGSAKYGGFIPRYNTMPYGN